MDKTYFVLHADSCSQLEDLVSSKMEEGFEPHGNLLLYQGKNEQTFFLQAVKKVQKKAWNGAVKKEMLPIIGKCPLCNGNLTYSSKGMIKCDNSSCNTGFYQYYGRSLTKEEATAIFSGQVVTLDNVQCNGESVTRNVKLSDKPPRKTDKINWFSLECVA